MQQKPIHKKFAQKQPLIFIAGFGAKCWMFQKSLEPLKDNFQIFIIDFSHPLKNKNLDIKHFADILNQFITDKKIKNPILVGASFGGAVCLVYCLHQKNYKKVIVLNPVGFLPLTYKKIIASSLRINKSLLNLKGLKLILNYVANIIFHLRWSLKKFRLVKKINFTKEQILKTKNLKIYFSNQDYLFPKKELKKLPKNLKIYFINGYHDWPITEPKKLQKIILQTCQN